MRLLTGIKMRLIDDYLRINRILNLKGDKQLIALVKSVSKDRQEFVRSVA